MIYASNAQNKTYTLGLTAHTDRTFEEWRVGLLNFCLSMVDIQLKYQISHGIQTILGLSVLYQRTILCRSGKWQKIFTMMRKSTHQLQKLRINNFLQVPHM